MSMEYVNSSLVSLKLENDFKTKGFCPNWSDDILSKCPEEDGTMDILSKIGEEFDDGNFDLTNFNVHDTEITQFIGYLQCWDFTENQIIPFLHLNWHKRNGNFLYQGQDNKERYDKFQNSSYGKYVLDMCGYTEQFEKIKMIHDGQDWPYSLSEKQINYLQTECEEVPWYRHNSWGFRSDEFDFDNKGDSILILGCSYVYGIGVTEKDRFSNIVSETLGLKNYNVGMSGASHDQAFLFAQYLILLLKPKHVIFLGPNITRTFHFNENLFKYLILKGFELNLHGNFQARTHSPQEYTSNVRWTETVEDYLEKPKPLHPPNQDDVSFVQYKAEHSDIFEFDICTNPLGSDQGEMEDIYFHQYVEQLVNHNSTNVYMNKLNASRNINAIKGVCYENSASFHYLCADDSLLPFNKTAAQINVTSISEMGDMLEDFVEDEKRATKEEIIEFIEKNKLPSAYDDYARDLSHPGKNTNRWLADYFLDSIKKVI